MARKRAKQTTPKYPVRMNGVDPFNPQRGVQTWTEQKTPKQIYAMKRAHDKEQAKAKNDKIKGDIQRDKETRAQGVKDNKNEDRNFQQNEANAAKHQRDQFRSHNAQQKYEAGLWKDQEAEGERIHQDGLKQLLYEQKVKEHQKRNPGWKPPKQDRQPERPMAQPENQTNSNSPQPVLAGLPQSGGYTPSPMGWTAPPQADPTHYSPNVSEWDADSGERQPGQRRAPVPEEEEPIDEVETGGPMARAPQPVLAGAPIPGQGRPASSTAGAMAPPTLNPQQYGRTSYGVREDQVARVTWPGEAIGS